LRATIGTVMAARRRAGAMRVYVEMVALLWDDGDMASVPALEDLWNDLARLRTFSLLCAYPTRAFDDEASAEASGASTTRPGTPPATRSCASSRGRCGSLLAAPTSSPASAATSSASCSSAAAPSARSCERQRAPATARDGPS
jgi:hypothetical protein